MKMAYHAAKLHFCQQRDVEIGCNIFFQLCSGETGFNINSRGLLKEEKLRNQSHSGSEISGKFPSSLDFSSCSFGARGSEWTILISNAFEADVPFVSRHLKFIHQSTTEIICFWVFRLRDQIFEWNQKKNPRKACGSNFCRPIFLSNFLILRNWLGLCIRQVNSMRNKMSWHSSRMKIKRASEARLSNVYSLYLPQSNLNKMSKTLKSSLAKFAQVLWLKRNSNVFIHLD